MTIVEERYRSHPTLPAIADELYVDVSQLRLACKTVVGVSPIAILRDRILAEAKRCLAYTTMPIGTLADWLGFSDVACFYRFYVKTTGLTPPGSTAYSSSGVRPPSVTRRPVTPVCAR